MLPASMDLFSCGVDGRIYADPSLLWGFALLGSDLVQLRVWPGQGV